MRSLIKTSALIALRALIGTQIVNRTNEISTVGAGKMQVLCPFHAALELFMTAEKG